MKNIANQAKEPSTSKRGFKLPRGWSNKISKLKVGQHVSYIYETEEEHRAVLTLFLKAGLALNQRVVYIADARDSRTIFDYLWRAGIGIDVHLVSGQFRLLTSDGVYLRDGVFNPDKMLSFLNKETKRAVMEGYSALRVTGEMTWVLRDFPGSEHLLEYESRLTSFLAEIKCLALCQYDRRKFNAEFLDSLVEHHSIIFCK